MIPIAGHRVVGHLTATTIRSALAHFQRHRPRHSTYRGIVVLVHPRLERPRAYGILGAQTKLERHRVTRANRIEIQNRLRSRQAELFQPSALARPALLLIDRKSVV